MADNYLEKQYEAYQARKPLGKKERKYGKKPSPMKRPKTLENQKRGEETPLLIPIWKILFECRSRQIAYLPSSNHCLWHIEGNTYVISPPSPYPYHT